MFVRLIERTAKPGRRTEILTILNQTLPIVRIQHGLLDAMMLTDESNPDHGITLTFWATREDLERFYSSPAFQAQTDRVRPLLETMAMHTCTVETSTVHRIAAAAA